MLAAYSVRRRVARGADGTVSVLWGSLGLRMSLAEFLDLAGVLAESMRGSARYGEIARGVHARVVRCSMGQVTLHHGDLTLWFTILTDEGQDTVAVEALAMLQGAVHRRTGHDQL